MQTFRKLPMIRPSRKMPATNHEFDCATSGCMTSICLDSNVPMLNTRADAPCGTATPKALSAVCDNSRSCPGLNRAIRRYEHRRWTIDDNRRVLPFSWGLEHIGGPATIPLIPARFLNPWVERTLAHSDDWYRPRPPRITICIPRKVPARASRALPSPASCESPWPENNLRLRAIFCRAQARPRSRAAAAVECQMGVQVNICRG